LLLVQSNDKYYILKIKQMLYAFKELNCICWLAPIKLINNNDQLTLPSIIFNCS